MKKRLGTLLLALLMLLSIVPGQCFAEEAAVLAISEDVETQQVSLPEDIDTSDNELEGYLYYLGGLKAPDTAASAPRRGVMRAKAVHTTTEEIIQLLIPKIREFAEGADASTGDTAEAVITISQAEMEAVGIKTTLTRADLGLSDTDPINTADIEALGYNGTTIFHQILSRLPYELYWMDKSYQKTNDLGNGYYEIVDSAFSFNSGIKFWVYGNDPANSMNYATAGPMTFTFKVSKDYAANGERGTSVAAKSKLSAAKETAAGAMQVVLNNKNKNNYEKLVAYKDYICKQVEYDHTAAADENYPYGDPWQMINVFRGKPVVCEGYSKAFKYLCDLTWKDASPAVKCYLATGTMTGGTGAGLHMWNIVTIGGKNYLADVTNSDAGSAGQYGGLFLNGVTGNVETRYVAETKTAHGASSQRMTFVYDDVTKSIYDTELILSDTNYDPQTAVSEQYDLNGGGFDISDLQYLFEYLSGTLAETIDMEKADVNGDGQVNILDYQALYEAYKVWVSKAA